MSFRSDSYEQALTRAAMHARAWLDSVSDRPVGPRATAAELLAAFDGPLPEGPMPPEDVVDMLATLSEPGLMAIQSGRFFGWVMGGTLPAALAADWLVSAWDQNTGMRHATPATATLEEAAAAWLLELLGLPTGSDLGFVTGATMANFTCLGAARTAVLSRLGWDVARDGLAGAPKVRVLAGEERHDTVDLALRYLGLGSPTLVAADDQGRIRVDALTESLKALESGTPVVVCLQAGNVHSGAFDPFEAAIEIAHEHQAWVHIDGAFGLWAAAAPSISHLIGRRRRRRFVGNGRAQDAQRPVRLRDRDCGGPHRHARHLRGARQLLDHRRLGSRRPSREGAGILSESAGRPRMGRASIAGALRGCRARRAACRECSGVGSWHRRHRRRSRRQRGRVHAGVRRIRRRCADARGHGSSDRRRHGVDVGLAVARQRHPSHLGQQLGDGRRRRASLGGRHTTGVHRGGHLIATGPTLSAAPVLGDRERREHRDQPD